jgi:endonuclease YncB( thermonuclease family)
MRHLAGSVSLALLLASAASAEVFFDARVSAVFDGDTIEVVRELGDGETRREKIRLAGIDAPERGQPWSRRAKQALSERVLGKPVRVNAVSTDRWGRTVGEVYADDVCVGCELLREGHVWVFRRYSDDRVLLGLEAEARAARRGLWSLPSAERIPPWEWRDGERGEGAEAPDRALDAPAFACGAKRHCREMQSCAEARFQLERCKLTGLDGDGDGIPCETLCGGR